MNKDIIISKYQKRINELKDFRKTNATIAITIAVGAVLAGLGLGYLLSSIPKTLMITLAVAGLAETYPIQGISRVNQKIEQLETDIEGIKHDKIFEKETPKTKTNTIKKENKYSYSYDFDKAYPSDYYDDFENKLTNGRR